MKSQNSRSFYFLLLVLISLTVLSSCNKDPYEIGESLLPPSDTLNLNLSDSATVVAYSMLQDSVRTDETTSNLIGSLQDPIFGNTTASFYSQLRLSAEAPDFGTNPVLDSVVMLLSYASIYGDTNAIQNIKVYEVSQDMYLDSSYYSVNHLDTYSNLLADLTFKARPNDSVTIDTVRVAPHLRINLSNITHYFGNKILYAPEDVLSSNTKFISYMKGLSFQATPKSSGGSLIGIKPSGGMTKMYVYFHNDSGDSLIYGLVINASCARFNTFNHFNYQGADPELRSQVINHDTTLGKEKLYLQGLGGIKIRLRLPHIKNYGQAGKIAINSATLVLKNYETDTTLRPPPSLNLVRIDSAGKIGFLVDEGEGVSYFGGTYNKADRTYEFRITRHVQHILNGTQVNNDLQLMVNDPSVNALYPYRIILNGTQPSSPFSSDRIQLKLVYTKSQ